MKKLFAVLILLMAVASVGYFYLLQHNYKFWIAPPPEKFAQAVQSDLNLLKQNNTLPKIWPEISKVELQSDASPVQDWLRPELFVPTLNAKGGYRLDVFATQWIDGYRYGALVQYDIIDLKTKNTVWELSRTYKLGIIY